MKTERNSIQHVLLDVNVCIDLLVNRSILPDTKMRLFSVFLNHQIDVYLPAFSIDTIFYILNSSMKIDKLIAKNAIQKLLKYTRLLHSTDESIRLSFTSHFSDFEDGMINALAETNHMDAIITANISNFSASSLPVYRPEDFIALFE